MRALNGRAQTRLRAYSLWFYLAIPALLIVFLPIPASLTAPQERYFRLEASSFQFSPEIIRVNPGDQVTIDLVSLDYVHGLSIDGYDFEISADPGQTAQVQFQADKPGSFRMRCSVACGAMHPFMLGKLQVGSNQLFYRGLALGILIFLVGLWRLNP